MPDTNAAYEAPVSRSHQRTIAAVGTAGNDLTTDLIRVDADGVVDAVYYIPASTITGAATNNRSLSLVNLGAAGSGTTVIATLGFGNGTNATAHVAKAIPLSGTAANLVVAAGDILQWQSTHVGTGIADPGGAAVVVVGRT